MDADFRQHDGGVKAFLRGINMTDKLRLGIIGANMRSHWASRSHFPALLASADWEVTAVCTTRQESADEACAKMGAKLAFDDYRKMVASPEIDAVLVVVRVPSHYEPTRRCWKRASTCIRSGRSAGRPPKPRSLQPSRM
jgi:hypothetical protein